MIYSILVLVFAGISFACHAFALVLLIKKPKLRKNFGDVLILLFALGLLYDIHWLTLNSSVKNAISSFCFEYAIFNTGIYFFVWNYSSVLSLQLYGKLQNRSEAFFKHRNLVYHLSCSVISIFETVAIIILGKFGQTSIQTCFITDSSPGEIIYLIPLVLNVPIGILASLKYLLNPSKEQKYFPACLVLISLLMTWGTSPFFIFLSYFLSLFNNRFYSECSVSISGLFLLVSLVLNKYSLKKLKNNKSEVYERVIYFKSNFSLLTSGPINSSSLRLQHSSSVDMLINYLEDHEKIVKPTQNLLKLYALVIARFSIGEPSSGSECETPVKKHQYEESILQELEVNLNFSYFSKCKFYIVEVFNLVLKEHYYSDLMLVRYNKNLFDKEILESLLNYQNFYNLENFNDELLNREIFTADKKLLLRMVKKSDYKKIGKIVEGFMKNSRLQNIFEQLLAVFEVEVLNRVFIMSEGIGCAVVCQKFIKISGESVLGVQSFDSLNGELVKSREDISVICIEKSQILEEIENGIEFLSKSGAVGYNIDIILLEFEQFCLNSHTIKVRSGQIKVKITNIYKTQSYKKFQTNIFYKRRDLCETYKACILKNFQKVFKLENLN